MVGAGGFEPPNTGSKVPRLTAWPRPSRARQAIRKRLSVADLRTSWQLIDVAQGCLELTSRGNRASPAFVVGARQGSRHERLRAVTGQVSAGFHRLFRGRAA